MTREHAKKWINEITAFANGEEILLFNTGVKAWTRTFVPEWYLDGIYVINDKHVEARKAYAMGEEIEYLDEDGKWSIVRKPSWLYNINYRVKLKWVPKQGEMVEVSKGRVKWKNREFICMTKDNAQYICFNINGMATSTWYYARELPNE